MTSSISVAGALTPSLGGVARQGGELFKKFGTLDNRLGVCDISLFILLVISNLSFHSLQTVLRMVDSTL